MNLTVITYPILSNQTYLMEKLNDANIYCCKYVYTLELNHTIWLNKHTTSSRVIADRVLMQPVGAQGIVNAIPTATVPQNALDGHVGS